MSLAAAIKARWNATGLNTTIKDIWAGAGGPDDQLKVDDASPTKEALPRARFVQMDAVLIQETSSCKQYEQDFFIYVYSKTPSDLPTWRELIRQAFENSHLRTVAPFDIAEATVNQIELEEWLDSPRLNQVGFSECLFTVGFTILKVLPS